MLASIGWRGPSSKPSWVSSTICAASCSAADRAQDRGVEAFRWMPTPDSRAEIRQRPADDRPALRLELAPEQAEEELEEAHAAPRRRDDRPARSGMLVSLGSARRSTISRVSVFSAMATARELELVVQLGRQAARRRLQRHRQLRVARVIDGRGARDLSELVEIVARDIGVNRPRPSPR
ncbi:MAG: hypothetical protein U1E17_06145 [Geminicoccaceae bacterium]